ncbi:hypothetical protein HK096_006989, partial [Nowakowskiella sp. JEL0078]
MSKVIIAGAGTFGLSTAIALAKRGHNVSVFDRMPVPVIDASSTDINKVIRPDYGNDEEYTDLMLSALPIWHKWQTESSKLFNDDVPLFDQCGGVFFTSNVSELTDETFPEAASIKTLRARAKLLGFQEDPATLYLDSSVLVEKYPALSGLTKKYPQAYVSNFTGWANSSRTNEYACKVAEKLGVKFVFGNAGIFKELIKDNSTMKVNGFVTLDGQKHLADITVLAMGSWMPSVVPEVRDVLVSTGQITMQFKIPEQLKSKYTSDKFPIWMADRAKTGFYGFPMRNDTGILKVSKHGPGYLNFVETDTGSVSTPITVVTNEDLTIPRQSLLEYRNFLETILPEINALDIQQTRMCWYTESFDGNFLICSLPNTQNLIVATGGSGHAFKFTPIIGEVVADVAEKKETRFTKKFAWRKPKPNEIENLIKKNRNLKDAQFIKKSDYL